MELPCDIEGICMACKTKPLETETLTCKTCITPWHSKCLKTLTLVETVEWECPDCTSTNLNHNSLGPKSELVAKIQEIESDETLSDIEKAKKRQELVSGRVKKDEKGSSSNDGVLEILDESLNCSFCKQLPDRPVTTPCGHNFCLKCFQRWIGQGKYTCANCRAEIPPKMASQPRINSALVDTIRMAKMSNSKSTGGPPKMYHFVHNQDRPDKCYTTERAKKTGKANACSGKIFVTIAPDHFGPILAENDPQRNQGVLVGETWEDRMECRQWGAHLPHVAGIAGQSKFGAQSVALSGGYEDDEDHGEWFLYTGSGGRDLSNNKRTNKKQSSNQKFCKSNEALRESCRQGYPVRVVRSHKEKRSSYAPETGVRYDGIYRIEKCWAKVGIQGFKVCRYLFVRCDNAPAPWTSDEQGDKPRPLPSIKELENATDVTERKVDAFWDFDEGKSCWMWKKPPPASRKQVDENGKIITIGRKKRTLTTEEKLLKELGCLICQKVMSEPITTPCGHNFCKVCLEGAFSGKSFTRITNCEGRRSLRTRKNIMKCPSCSNDIAEFLQNPQVNREMMGIIQKLQKKKENVTEKESSEESDAADKKTYSDSGEDDDQEDDEDEDNEEEEEEDDEDRNLPAKTINITGGDDVKKAIEDEDGKKGIQDSPTNQPAENTVASKRKRASGDGVEKAKAEPTNKRKRASE